MNNEHKSDNKELNGIDNIDSNRPSPNSHGSNGHKRRSKKLGARSIARSISVQGLYCKRINQHISLAELEQYLHDDNPKLYARAEHELLSQLLNQGTAEFDEHLKLYEPFSSRALKDITVIEQSILVIAAIELSCHLQVPAVVVINEAVELAKLYGAGESYKFINSLVDKLAGTLRQEVKTNSL